MYINTSVNRTSTYTCGRHVNASFLDISCMSKGHNSPIVTPPSLIRIYEFIPLLGYSALPIYNCK